MKPFEVFRTGTHYDSKGREVTITQGDLEAIAQNYNTDLAEAPLVHGHPIHNSPAHGWVESFSVKGDRLIAHPKDVTAEFAEGVKSGTYPKRSISLFLPGDKSNPAPGSYYPRHIGFLGGAAPAVSGLRPVEFSAEDGFVEFSQGEGFGQAEELLGAMSWIVGGLKRLLRLSGDPVSPVTEFSELPDGSDLTSQHHIHTKKEPSMAKDTDKAALDFAAQQDQLKADQDKLAQDRADFAAQQAEVRKASDLAFLSELEAAGKLPPAHKDGLVEFMGSLSDQAPLEFSGADGQASDQTALSYFKSLIGGASPVINFSEVSASDEIDKDISAPTAEGLSQKAVEFQKSQADLGITVSIADAVAHVKKEAQT